MLNTAFGKGMYEFQKLYYLKTNILVNSGVSLFDTLWIYKKYDGKVEEFLMGSHGKRILYRT